MPITQQNIDQAFADKKELLGGLKEDYFGWLYLQDEFDLTSEQAALQNAFGGHDYGVDAFHIDVERRNLYLLQFKWSPSYTTFKQSYERLIANGMEMIFGNPKQDAKSNALLSQLKSRLLNDMALIDRVFIHFVFTGSPEDAERSTALEALREDLESKKYLIDQFFERPMSLVIEYRSSNSGKSGGAAKLRKTYTYEIEMADTLERGGPDGERMHIGFAKLLDLHRMYREMRHRFFERNIRSSLSEDEAPNRAIKRSLKQIVIDGSSHPSIFAFNHNGVTIHAQSFEHVDGSWKITEPRLLNGAQTVTTFARFLELNEGNQALKDRGLELNGICVPCRIITKASSEFVTGVTINNNRQNPVMPWNLRANDLIQCQLADKFKDDLEVFYERQENMFASLTDADMEELEVSVVHRRPIELLRLTKTFLATDGLIDKVSNMREAFENDNVYEDIFNEKRLKFDSRKILLCYKAQFRLNRLAQSIMEKGANRYAFLNRARNLLWALLCQGILNDENLEGYCEVYGHGLVIEANYGEWLTSLATTRVRYLIGDLIKQEPYATNVREENYGFLRTQVVFKKCMDIAHHRWGWVHRKMK